MNSLKDDLEALGLELIETHTAWVFRGPETVWKVKKPVNYGFLDYSTLEKRRQACEAEVRLNQRLAPDVYRSVVPVMRAPTGRYVLQGEGEIVDWAVGMRRLSDGDRADLRLSSGSLAASDVDSIAEYLSEFHARMPATEAIAEFGMPDRILANVRENFSQTRGLIEPLLGADEARELEAKQTRFFEDHRALLLDRVKKGHIRDGHGDLRLEHVYLKEGQDPTIIDCIEFNERFRYADTCADVAFLSMDFERFGRADLAERFLSAYARASSDYDLYTLIDAYEGYRAYVRGKVAAFLSDDIGASHEVRERATKDARQAFLLALSKGRPALLSPAVVAVGGIIASGKSTVAGRIADLLGAPVVDADRTRKALFGVSATEPLRDDAFRGAYSPGATDRVYEEAFRRASCVLASGRPVILDASFRSRALREGVRELARRHGVPFFFVECRASREETEWRLETRAKNPSVSDGRREILDAFVAKWEPTVELASSEHLVLDTSRPLEATLEELGRRLPAWPAGLNG